MLHRVTAAVAAWALFLSCTTAYANHDGTRCYGPGTNIFSGTPNQFTGETICFEAGQCITAQDLCMQYGGPSTLCPSGFACSPDPARCNEGFSGSCNVNTFSWSFACRRNGTIFFCSQGFGFRENTHLGDPDVQHFNDAAFTDSNKRSPKNIGALCPLGAANTATNPINSANGNKYQKETDFRGAGAMPLIFERHYNSDAPADFPISGLSSFAWPSIGEKWRTNFDRSVGYVPSETPPLAQVARPDGRILTFYLQNREWVSDPDVRGTLEQIQLGWRFTNQDNLVEEYDSDGKLVSISQTKGNPLAQTLSYDLSDRLTTVTGPFGRSLTFAYDSSDRIASMTDAASNVYKYAYANDNLVSVLYPDETPSDDSDNPKRIYHYEDADFPNALTGITDERGIRFSTYAYDVQGRAILSEHAGGANRHELAFTAAGPTTITDPLGQTREYTNTVIHGSNKNIGISGGPCATCGSQSSTTTYDANGFPASITDYNGNVTTFVHDARGLETSRTEAVGTPEERTSTTHWHVDFRLPTLITEPGKATEFAYDPQGRLLTRTETDTLSGNTRTITNTYSAQGLLASRDGPRTDVSDVTTLIYDSRGNLSEVMNAFGHINRVTAYDPNGRPLTLEDPNGLIVKLTYDARGRLTSRDVGGQLTSFKYDSTGNITKTTLADGSFLVSEYDDAQRLIAMEDKLGNRTEFTLDAAGNRVAETVQDPGSTITRTRSRIYNSLNRLIRDVGGAGQTSDFEFDLQGNQTAVIDGNNARTASEYDALNRLAKSIDPNFGETTFGYDTRDNLTSVTDAEGLTTTFAYDGLDNLVAQMSPDTGLTWFTYDDAGNRLTQTDARGVQAQFGYDALNRLVSITYPDTTKDVGFEYDRGPNGIGRLARMTDASGSTDFAYDIRGNLLSETRTVEGVGYVTAYTYDSANRVLTITYPSGTVITYTRDALGRIAAVSATSDSPLQVLASNIAYLPFGPIEGFDYGNGIPLARMFDRDYRLSSQTADGVQDIALGYDPANNVTSLIDGLDATRSQSFVYDKLNRLTQGQGIYGTKDYSYDRIGNRLSLSSSAGMDTYDYILGSHRLAAITGPNETSFDYDANGNTLAKGSLSLTYDDTNRMTQISASGVPLAAYTYNARGERVSKSRISGGSAPSERVLLSDTFSAPDGTVIDDQPGGAWRGKRPEAAISATVIAGHARVTPGQAIRTVATFTDTGDTTLVVRATLAQGTLVLKHPGAPRGVRVRYNGKRRVVVTGGVFDDETQRTRVVFQLPTPGRHLAIALHLRAGTTRVVVTDDEGASYDTGALSNARLRPDDLYRLKLRAINVKGVQVPGLIDNLEVSRRTDADPAATTHFVYDQAGRLIGEYDATATPIAEYVYLENQPVALLRGGATYYYHTDHLGTPHALTDQNQELVWRAHYAPFGSTLLSVNIVENALRFPGQYFDAETGLHYNYFRDYDPSIGRYHQSDPTGLAGGVNTYAYVVANPIRYDDRFGLESFDGGDLGALVRGGQITGSFVFNLVTVATQFQIGKLFDPVAHRLRFAEIGALIVICEKPFCDDVRSADPTTLVSPPNPFSNPRLRARLRSLGIPGFRFVGVGLGPDGSQCFMFGANLGPPLNESLPLGQAPFKIPDTTGMPFTGG